MNMMIQQRLLKIHQYPLILFYFFIYHCIAQKVLIDQFIIKFQDILQLNERISEQNGNMLL